MGPRIFASLLYGDVAFTGVEGANSAGFMWIPLIGPLVGGAIAGCTYLLFISGHWPENQSEVTNDETKMDELSSFHEEQNL